MHAPEALVTRKSCRIHLSRQRPGRARQTRTHSYASLRFSDTPELGIGLFTTIGYCAVVKKKCYLYQSRRPKTSSASGEGGKGRSQEAFNHVGDLPVGLERSRRVDGDAIGVDVRNLNLHRFGVVSTYCSASKIMSAEGRDKVA